MPDFLSRLFESNGFMPHGHCYLWNPSLVRLHLLTDLAIGVSYIAISVTLLYLVWRAKQDVPFSWIFVCFGVFIIACGGTHFMEVWTLWTPVYWLSGAVKFVTAAASVLTAIALPPLVPKALALIRVAKVSDQGKMELEAANQALQREIIERERREGEIQELNLELERRVAARTAQLAEANRSMAQMAAIVEHSADAIVSLDLDGRITTWNAAAERLYEYGLAEILGRLVSVLEPAGLPVQMSALAERARGGEAIRSFETTGVRKSGETFRMRFTLSAIRNEGGAVQGTSLIAREVPERKRVEEMLRLTMEAAPNAMVMADQEGKIVLVNSQTERLFGYPREELLGAQVEILVPHKYRGKHPAYRSKFMHEPAARAMGAGRDLYGLRKDGSEFPVEIGLNPIQTDQGIWVLSAIVDITERKRAGEVLRLAVDASPNAMVMADGEGNIVLVNSQTEKLFGYLREELLGKPVDVLVPHKYRQKHPDYRSGFMRDPHARSMGAGRDLYGLRKDGSEFPVEIGLNPIQTEQGTWVLSAIVDITERKRSGEMLRLAVDASPNAMVMADSEGKIVLVNSQTEKLFGYLREELLGKPVDILVPHKYRPKHPAYRSDFMRAPDARAMGAGRDLHGLRKDGSEFPVEIGLNPIHTEEGTLVLSAIVDITERKRAEDEIQRLNQGLEYRVEQRTRELTAANAELEAFSYTVSHDLRAPLRQIAGFSSILAEEHSSELSAEFRRYLQMVQDGAQQMGLLIDDLLNLARIGRQPVSRRLTPLNDLVRGALDQLDLDGLNREIEWRIEELGSVECDPALFKLVFVNLLSNAVKYTRLRERAVIEVGQTTIDQERVIFVRDNGAGFDMEYADKLFGVFQRLHKAKDFEGTGVGLATVQRIIHKHGGRVWADAKVDKGATFHFTIPAGNDSGYQQGEP